MNKPLLGILGGTLNPITNAHLHIANSCYRTLDLDSIQFIPNNVPPHRPQPSASAVQRLKMVELATAPYPHFSVNHIEIDKPGTSYAIDTLRQLAAKHQNKTLCFILGTDAFKTFCLWKDYEQILTLCHLIVVNRPDFEFPESKELQELEKKYRTKNAKDLQTKSSGFIYFQHIEPTPTSAAEIRKDFRNGSLWKDIDVPEAVQEYIVEQGLYTQPG